VSVLSICTDGWAKISAGASMSKTPVIKKKKLYPIFLFIKKTFLVF